MISFYSMRSVSDNISVAINHVSTIPCSDEAENDLVYLTTCDSASNKGLMISVDNSKPHTGQNSTNIRFLKSVFIYYHNDSVVSLVNPENRKFLSLSGAPGSDSSLSFCGDSPGANEQFIISNDVDRSQFADSELLDLEVFSQNPLSKDSLLGLNGRNKLVFEAFVELLTDSEKLRNTELLIEDWVGRSRLSKIYEYDPIIKNGIINNSHRSLKNDGQRRMPELGFPSTAADPGTPVSTAFSLNAYARRRQRPNKRVCILATARNEGPYILEWVAHYHSLGITDIFIYYNNCDDGSNELIRSLDKHGFVVGIENNSKPDEAPQKTAHTHALSVDSTLLDYEWCLMIDLDEYLILHPDRFNNIESYLDLFHEADAIAINWRVSTANENLKLDFGSHIMDRCDSFMPYIDPHIKCLIRPRQFITSHAHVPVTYENRSYVFKSSDGGEHRARHSQLAFSEFPVASQAWINHYLYRSVDEFLVRWTRNRGDGPLLESEGVYVLDGFIDAFMDHFFHKKVQLNSMISSIVERSKRYVNEMMEIRELSDIQDDIIGLYRNKARRARDLFLSHPGLVGRPENIEKFKALISQAAKQDSSDLA